MRRRRMRFLCCIFALIAAPAVSLGEIVEVPLSAALGAYSGSSHRVIPIDLGGPVAEVESASIRWSGSITFGMGQGDGVERPPDDQFAWPASMTSYFDPSEPDLWLASTLPQEGGFVGLAPYGSFLDPGWEFLLDGQADVVLELSMGVFIGGVLVTSPTAQLWEAVLVLDVVYQTAVPASTWGSIKALYNGVLRP